MCKCSPATHGLQGLDALDFKEHIDYDLVESTNPAFNKAIVRINVFRNHRQACLCRLLACQQNHHAPHTVSLMKRALRLTIAVLLRRRCSTFSRSTMSGWRRRSC